MKIGELANRVGIQVETVRFYERSGLMPPPARRASGYREYDNNDVQRLRFVLRTKALGFSLIEIRELLVLSDSTSESQGGCKAPVEAKLAEIETRLTQLTEIRDTLRMLISDAPPDAATGSGGADRNARISEGLA